MATISRQEYNNLFGPTQRRQNPVGRQQSVYRNRKRPPRIRRREWFYGGGKNTARRHGSGQHDDLQRGFAGLGDYERHSRRPHCGCRPRPTSASRMAKSPELGKAGNPNTMQGVDPNLVTGAATDAISGEHLILTAARHRRPRPFHLAATVSYASLSNGITDPHRRRCRPDRRHERNDHHVGTLEHREDTPVHRGAARQHRHLRQGQLFGRTAHRRTDQGRCLRSEKSTRTGGSTPAAIRTALSVADRYDIQVAIHPPTRSTREVGVETPLQQWTAVPSIPKSHRGRRGRPRTRPAESS